jgi:phosphate starvation-inducible PhoH-like protein
VEAMHVVSKIEGIEFIYFDERDVVRHKLVQAIVKAYETYGDGAQTPQSSRRPA